MSFFLKAFLTLFVVIDLIGLSPIFVTLAGNRSPTEQVRIARQAILVAGGIVLVNEFSRKDEDCLYLKARL